MWMTLALGSALFFGFSQFTLKAATQKYLDQYILLGLYLAGTLLFYMLCYNQITFIHSTQFVLASVFIALGSYLGNWAILKAVSIGPGGFTNAILKFNLVFIILMSGIFYNEHFTYFKIIVILFLFLGLLFVKFNPREKRKIKHKSWFAFVFLGIICLFLRDGGLKITQELGINNKELLFFVYLICIIFTAITMLIISKNKKINEKEFTLSKYRMKSMYFGAIAGLCSSLGLYWYSAALAVGPTSLTALIFSTRSFIVVGVSYAVLKEKLSISQRVAFILIILGICLSGFIQ